MININFIVSSQDYLDKVKRLIAGHPQKEMIHYDTVHMTNDVDDSVLERALSCDIIIARGYSLERLLRLNPKIPYIILEMDVLDIINTIESGIAGHAPRKIGLIWSYYITPTVEKVCNLFSPEVVTYKCDGHLVPAMIQKARTEGCDTIVGGNTVRYWIEKYNRSHRQKLNYVPFLSGDRPIIKAIDESIRTVNLLRKEREHSEVLQTTLELTRGGILYVDETRVIRSINNNALQTFSLQRGQVQGRELPAVFPFMGKHMDEVIASGVACYDEICRLPSLVLSISYIPISVKGQTSGVVINFQDISEIQRTEAKIRKKLSEKGYVAKYRFADIVSEHRLLRDAIQMAQRFAANMSNVVINGETGTGKEMFAQSIHNASERVNEPFIAVNCASLAESLLESELFGYVDGAFTGAVRGGKPGLFELAHRGTLFLDEISEVSLSFQSKLLRVLQEHEVRRIGDDKFINVNVRIIASTNKDLRELVENGGFREDLLYRLDVLRLYLPPLRERRGDIPKIFLSLLMEQCARACAPLPEVTQPAILELMEYPFYGNVRELRNITERIMVASTGEPVTPAVVRAALYPNLRTHSASCHSGRYLANMDEPGKAEVIAALNESGHNLTAAARQMGINRSTLWRRMRKYGIEKHIALSSSP